MLRGAHHAVVTIAMAIACSLTFAAFDAFRGSPVRFVDILWEAVTFGALFGFFSWFTSRARPADR